MSGRKKHKWSIDFVGLNRFRPDRNVVALPVDLSRITCPIGCVEFSGNTDRPKEADSNLIIKSRDSDIQGSDMGAITHGFMSRQRADSFVKDRSWDIALGPVKQIPMNMFIMWMAGSSISIFPIMMVGMMFFRPIQAILSIHKTFKTIEGQQAMIQKFIFILGNLACLAMAVYKCQVMGLLPTHASDWLAFAEPQQFAEPHQV